MNNILELLLIIFVIAFQTLSGYLGKKYLGAILPIIFSGLVVYIVIRGQLDFSFKNILIPFVGLVALICMYESGKESKKKKLEKELEKMKAKDILKR